MYIRYLFITCLANNLIIKYIASFPNYVLLGIYFQGNLPKYLAMQCSFSTLPLYLPFMINNFICCLSNAFFIFSTCLQSVDGTMSCLSFPISFHKPPVLHNTIQMVCKATCVVTEKLKPSSTQPLHMWLYCVYWYIWCIITLGISQGDTRQQKMKNCCIQTQQKR